MAYGCLSKEKRAELQFIPMEYELLVDTQETGKFLLKWIGHVFGCRNLLKIVLHTVINL